MEKSDDVYLGSLCWGENRPEGEKKRGGNPSIPQCFSCLEKEAHFKKMFWCLGKTESALSVTPSNRRRVHTEKHTFLLPKGSLSSRPARARQGQGSCSRCQSGSATVKAREEISGGENNQDLIPHAHLIPTLSFKLVSVPYPTHRKEATLQKSGRLFKSHEVNFVPTLSEAHLMHRGR